MTGVKEQENIYLAEFERHKRSNDPAWINSTRESAMRKFLELGFPTTKVEEWKYTNVAPIARTEFSLSKGAAVEANELDRATFADMGCAKVVVVDGKYASAVGVDSLQDKGIQIGSLAELISSEDPVVKAHLARYADYDKNAFVALNTAFINDGVFVHIPDGIVLDEPIQLVFVSTGREANTVSHPRVLIVAGRDSQASVVESFVGLNSQNTTFTNAVTEIAAGENSHIEHYRLQAESDAAFHVSTLQISQDRNSGFASLSIMLGGSLVRNDVNVVLDGEGSEVLLEGLYIERGDQLVDNHTLIDHARPHCSSRELYKGILGGKSKGVFNGSVIVRKDAQKSDARQSNRNLLLSDEAEINTKPQLEIFADDVKCTHGATIGQIDQESIFYLRSRGIDLASAKAMLMYAFTNEIIERIKPEAVRSRVSEAVFSRLSDE